MSEMKDWADLILAQESGKQLERSACAVDGTLYWRADFIGRDTPVSPSRWRIAVGRPPQQLLDKENVEIVAGPFPWGVAVQDLRFSDDVAAYCSFTGRWYVCEYTMSHHRALGTIDGDETTYIVRKKAPKILPYTAKNIPLPIVIEFSTGDLFMVTSVSDKGVRMVGGANGSIQFSGTAAEAQTVFYSFEDLSKLKTRDGKPCGIVSK